MGNVFCIMCVLLVLSAAILLTINLMHFFIELNPNTPAGRKRVFVRSRVRFPPGANFLNKVSPWDWLVEEENYR